MNREKFLRLFFDLVRLYSPTGKENGVAFYIINHLKNFPQVTYIQDNAGESFGGECGNLIVRFCGNNKARTPIALLAHMDVVEPGEDIKPEIDEKGRIFSASDTILGADDKSAIAVLLLLLEEAVNSPTDFGEIEFIFTVGEEKNLLGSKALDTTKLNAKYGLVLDSNAPVGTMITSAPYAVNIKIKIKGRSAHAGVEPEKGINALSIAVKGIINSPLGRVSPITTSNLGKIQGGLATNIVMEDLEIDGEARSLEVKELNETIDRIQTAFKLAGEEFGGSVDFIVQESFPGYKLDENIPFVRLLAEKIANRGCSPIFRPSGGGSDANILNSKGLPSLNLGLAFHNPHSKDEYIMLDDVALLFDILMDFAKSI